MLREQIAQCLEHLPFSFRKDELAYLSLTSKPELHLRDKLAFDLQNRLTDRLVCREWRRHDIAILPRGSDVADAIIEAKVFYTFDGVVPNKLHHMKEALSADIDKMKRNGPNAERMALLFLVHPQTLIPEASYEAIAYAQRVNSVYRKNAYGGPGRVLTTAKDNLEIFWEEVGAPWIRSGNYAAGVYEGVEVLIPYWLAEV
ncbi:MAG: hypothetical protein ABSA41_11545 [Terriglobia bacterium]|jgi:hypothetical protein